MEISINLAVQDIARSATAFPSISISNHSRLLHQDGIFRIADTANALASGDALGLEMWELVFKRNYKIDDYTNEQQTALEPVESGFREVMLNIKLPRYEADTFADYKDNETDLQIRLVVVAQGVSPRVVLEQVEGGEEGKVDPLLEDQDGLNAAVGQE